jgi:putative transposase
LFEPESLRDEFVAVLAAARLRHRFRLIAWVLMPEHIHLLLVPTVGLGVGSAMPSILIGIKKSFSQRVLEHWRRHAPEMLEGLRDSSGEEHFWLPGGGFDRNTRNADELARTIQYIHHNPVKRGLVACATDWKWSSARWYAGERKGVLPVDPLDFRLPGPGQIEGR